MKKHLQWGNLDSLLSALSKERKDILRVASRGNEYDIKAIADAFDIPDEFDTGDISEYEAREMMREEVLVHCISCQEEELKEIIKLLRDKWYLFND